MEIIAFNEILVERIVNYLDNRNDVYAFYIACRCIQDKSRNLNKKTFVHPMAEHHWVQIWKTSKTWKLPKLSENWETVTEEIAQSGNLHLMRFVDPYLASNTKKYLEWAADEAHFKFCMYLVDRFHLTIEDIRTTNKYLDNYVLNKAVEEGHLKFFMYLVDRFHLTAEYIRNTGKYCENYILHRAAAKGHLEIVKYLVNKYNITVNDINLSPNFVFSLAIKNGHWEIVKYLVDTFHFTMKDVESAAGTYFLEMAIRNEHFKLVIYFVITFNLFIGKNPNNGVHYFFPRNIQ